MPPLLDLANKESVENASPKDSAHACLAFDPDQVRALSFVIGFVLDVSIISWDMPKR